MSLSSTGLSEATRWQPAEPSPWSGDFFSEVLGSPWYRDVAVLSGAVQTYSTTFFAEQAMSSIAVPVTTSSISSPIGRGSDSLPVCASIGGRDVYLADSMQFLLEVGVRIVPAGAFYTSCSFRGEPVDATHLNEFTHTEVEIPGGLDDIVELGSRYVSSLAERLLQHHELQIVRTAGTTAHLERLLVLGAAIPRIRFEDAQRLLATVPNAFQEIEPGVPAITRTGERALLERCGEALWLTHLPALACPFYQRPEPGTASCLSADLLIGAGEVLGAGERCPDGESVSASLSAHGVDPEPYDWYVRMKDLRPMRTAGCGLGIERFLMWLLQTDDIRRCTLWRREFGVEYAP